MATPTILTDVFAVTARPDRVNESMLGIRQALQIAHAKDNFPNDLIEVRLQADAEAIEVQATLDTNVRKISHIVPQYLQVDGSFERGDALNYVEPRMFHKMNLQNMDKDFYYTAGRALNIRIRNPTRYFQMGYWKYPDVSDDAINTDWIVLNYPQVVIYGAVSMTYRALGNAQDAVAYQQLFADAMQMMANDILHLGDVADSNEVDETYEWGGQGGIY